jgi:hypothetical protein
MVIAALLLATIVAPVALAYGLRRTRAWWVAGLLVAGFGMYLLLPIELGAYGGAGDLLVQVFAVLLFVHAAILLLASRSARIRTRTKGAGWLAPKA